MSLSKKITIDKVEFVGEYRILQVRQKIEVLETIDDIEKIVSTSIHREVYTPDQLNPLTYSDDEGNEYQQEGLPDELKPFVEGVWTGEFIGKYNAYVESQNIKE